MTADIDRIRAYYESLPAKRVGAGLVFRDEHSRVLLVQPTYKPSWEIPGGTVEADESPSAAAAREVAEELGVQLPVGRLLVIDWLPVRPPKTEGLMILFDGGVLTDTITRRFRLPADELAAWRFFEGAELNAVLPDHMARRLRLAMELAPSGRAAVYLEHGLQPEAGNTADSRRPTLLLMKGSPGTGKSTIAQELGRRLGWPVIDKDVVRDLVPDELGGLSYEAMLGFAERQLAIGLSVVADSPLGYGRSYARALEIGEQTKARVLVLECECSNVDEWQRRLERRQGMGLASHHTVDQSGVEAFKSRGAADPYEISVPYLVLDTASPLALDAIVASVLTWVQTA